MVPNACNVLSIQIIRSFVYSLSSPCAWWFQFFLINASENCGLIRKGSQKVWGECISALVSGSPWIVFVNGKNANRLSLGQARDGRINDGHSVLTCRYGRGDETTNGCRVGQRWIGPLWTGIASMTLQLVVSAIISPPYDHTGLIMMIDSLFSDGNWIGTTIECVFYKTRWRVWRPHAITTGKLGLWIWMVARRVKTKEEMMNMARKKYEYFHYVPL